MSVLHEKSASEVLQFDHVMGVCLTVCSNTSDMNMIDLYMKSWIWLQKQVFHYLPITSYFDMQERVRSSYQTLTFFCCEEYKTFKIKCP